MVSSTKRVRDGAFSLLNGAVVPRMIHDATGIWFHVTVAAISALLMIYAVVSLLLRPPLSAASS